ncbi:hypothetical protein DFJ74DRAFT_767066 [Hyaloraphidium curvatum]|nr:hypothetical protein DFJ74DRAFT_767066 [Hyaloraphidium curvatum]
MVFSVKDKAALVTGGTEGIGLAVVEGLLARGCKGVMIANRNEALAAEVLPRLAEKYGEGRARFTKMDLYDPASCKAAFAAAVDAFGSCEIVFANAGQSAEFSFLDGPDEGTMNTLSSLLFGTMMLAKAAVNSWRGSWSPGVFVANASLTGLHGVHDKYCLPFNSYYTSKAGLIGFCAALQGDLEARAWQAGLDRSPIRTGAVCPGSVFTGLFPKSGIGKTEEEAAASPLWRHMLPMFGGWTPMEAVVAAVVRLIEDEECRGTALVVSGEGGEAKEYPKIDVEDFLSRGGKPGSCVGEVETIKRELLDAANEARAGAGGGKA